MKAGPRRLCDEEALTPIAGTVLMVAVTIVLSGVAYGVVAALGDADVVVAPPVAIRSTEESSMEVVSSGGSDVDWQDLHVVGCDKPADEGPVVAGQSLADCSGRVTMVHGPSGTLLYDSEING